jgi:hypothetical protein
MSPGAVLSVHVIGCCCGATGPCTVMYKHNIDFRSDPKPLDLVLHTISTELTNHFGANTKH